MDRRAFIAGLAGSLLAAPLAAEAQQAGAVYRIGFLSGTTVPELLQALRQGLTERGWIEGQHFALEHRSAEAKFQEVPELAADLARRNVDVIVVSATAIAYLKQTTVGIPIVFG